MTDRWRLEAACKGADVQLFFPDKGTMSQVREALEYCNRCPVTTQCLADALTEAEQHGIRGGHTANEREQAIRKGYMASKYADGHGDAAGTLTGFWRERAAGLKPCPDCRAAYNVRARENAAKRKAQKACTISESALY